jgi:hypothetical protein
MPLEVELANQLKGADIPGGVTGWDALLGATIWDINYANRGVNVLAACEGSIANGNTETMYTVPPGFYAIVEKFYWFNSGTESNVRLQFGTANAVSSIGDTGAANDWGVIGDQRGGNVAVFEPRTNYNTNGRVWKPVVIDGDSPTDNEVTVTKVNVGSTLTADIMFVLTGAAWPKGLK